ncbi:hypothetical protein KC340_g8665 [Hortaea werneckii]|nr:hypothetical protein KC342_g8996 [Hortaea werneckii]KAI7095609.1 hypothetical protein KC339_g10948 [Hortaea werneckii]KAI7212205.1 hypothetical protein KC365_g14685 [Hortaea werneckii]KAI7316458.1 hypothetical protein KC340_g8665 [Hortaea werneckii]KAI7393552.1 hypothetical protein KC328_g6555 [Hortaea werneckii]
MEYKHPKNLKALEGLAGSLSGHDSCQRYASGRVSSVTARSGIKVRIQYPSCIPRKRADLFIKSIQRTILIKGRYTEPIKDVPSGNILGLVGIDQSLLKSGNLSILGLAGIDQFLLKSGTLSTLGLDGIDQFLLKSDALSTSETAHSVATPSPLRICPPSGALSISETAQCDDDHGCHQGTRIPAAQKDIVTVKLTTVAMARDHMAEIVVILTNNHRRNEGA